MQLPVPATKRRSQQLARWPRATSQKQIKEERDCTGTPAAPLIQFHGRLNGVLQLNDRESGVRGWEPKRASQTLRRYTSDGTTTALLRVLGPHSAKTNTHRRSP